MKIDVFFLCFVSVDFLKKLHWTTRPKMHETHKAKKIIYIHI